LVNTPIVANLLSLFLNVPEIGSTNATMESLRVDALRNRNRKFSDGQLRMRLRLRLLLPWCRVHSTEQRVNAPPRFCWWLRLWRWWWWCHMSGTHLMDARRSLSFWASAQLSILNAIYAPVTQPADNWQFRLAAAIVPPLLPCCPCCK